MQALRSAQTCWSHHAEKYRYHKDAHMSVIELQVFAFESYYMRRRIIVGWWRSQRMKSARLDTSYHRIRTLTVASWKETQAVSMLTLATKMVQCVLGAWSTLSWYVKNYGTVSLPEGLLANDAGCGFGYSPAAPRSDPKKVEKLEKVEKKSQGRSLLSQGLIFLKVALCRQGIFMFFSRASRSGSVCVFLRCLQVFSYFLKVTQSFSQGARFSRFWLQACFDILRNLKV